MIHYLPEDKSIQFDTMDDVKKMQAALQRLLDGEFSGYDKTSIEVQLATSKDYRESAITLEMVK